MDVREYLKDAIYQSNQRQADIAEKLGISRQALNYLLKSSDTPARFTDVCKIAQAIGLEISILDSDGKAATLGGKWVDASKTVAAAKSSNATWDSTEAILKSLGFSIGFSSAK